MSSTNGPDTVATEAKRLVTRSCFLLRQCSVSYARTGFTPQYIQCNLASEIPAVFQHMKMMKEKFCHGHAVEVL